MQIEHSVYSSTLDNENYTFITFETLQYCLPGIEIQADEVIRDESPEPLNERTSIGKKKLLESILFQVS